MDPAVPCQHPGAAPAQLSLPAVQCLWERGSPAPQSCAGLWFRGRAWAQGRLAPCPAQQGPALDRQGWRAGVGEPFERAYVPDFAHSYQQSIRSGKCEGKDFCAESLTDLVLHLRPVREL